MQFAMTGGKELSGKMTHSNNGKISLPLLSFNELVRSLSRNLIWIILFALSAGAAGALYVYVTPKDFVRGVKVMIEGIDNNGGIGSLNEFAEGYLTDRRSNIDNEVARLHTVTLFEKVVIRLGLNCRLYKSDKLHSIEIYSNPPIAIRMAENIKPPYSLHIDIDNNARVVLSQIKFGNVEIDKEVVGTIGRPLSTPVGMITVDACGGEGGFKVENIDGSYDYKVETARDCALSLLQMLDIVRPSDKSSIVTLNMKGNIKKKSDDILIDLINIFNQERRLEQRKSIEKSAQTITDRLTVIENELRTIDGDISGYMSSRPNTASWIPGGVALAHMSVDSKAARENIVEGISRVRMWINKVRRLSPDSTIALIPDLESGVMNQVVGDYNSLVKERNYYMRQTSSEGPIVNNLTYALKEQKALIEKNTDDYLLYLESRLSLAKETERTVGEALTESPYDAEYMGHRQRSQKVKENLYLYLLRMREELAMASIQSPDILRIIETPYDSGGEYPEIVTIVSLSALGGGIVPVVWIVMMMIFSGKIRNKRDLEHLNLPILGEIPWMTTSKQNHLISLVVRGGKPCDLTKNRDLVVCPDGRDPVNDAFRMLRANLLMPTSDMAMSKGKVVLITSYVDGVGKSFVAHNLAGAIALKGKKVLLLDADLRKGSLSSFYKGASSGIGGVVEMDKTSGGWMSETARRLNAGFDFISAGSPGINPAEIFEHDNMLNFIKEARRVYDFVIVDTPTYHTYADTRILARYVDSMLVVVKTGKVSGNQISGLSEIYADGLCRDMGIIINGM